MWTICMVCADVSDIPSGHNTVSLQRNGKLFLQIQNHAGNCAVDSP